MATFWTDRGKKLAIANIWQAVSLPTNYYIALCTSATAPTSGGTHTMADLTEIAAGNGYTSGGFQLTPGSTDFTTLTEDDVNHIGSVVIKDITWTASGGTIPASGSGARYAVITDDNVTVSSRQVYAWFDLGSSVVVADTQNLTLTNGKLELAEA